MANVFLRCPAAITVYKLDKALVGRKRPPGVCNVNAMLIARPHACRPLVACQPMQLLARCQRTNKHDGSQYLLVQ